MTFPDDIMLGCTATRKRLGYFIEQK